MNIVTYCSTTRSPVASSTLRTLTVKRVPAPPTRTEKASAGGAQPGTGDERLGEVHVLLAVHDHHERLGGHDRPTAKPIASHVGTTANTGGAYLPDV